MKKISAKGTGGFWLFVPVIVNGKKLVALVDTGATSCLVDSNVFKGEGTNELISGIAGTLSSNEGKLKIECNGIKKKINVFTMDFAHIRSLCDSVKVPHYQMLIGTKQIIQFNLAKQIYDCLRNK